LIGRTLQGSLHKFLPYCVSTPSSTMACFVTPTSKKSPPHWFDDTYHTPRACPSRPLVHWAPLALHFHKKNTVNANKCSVAVDHDGWPSGFIYEGEGVLPEVLTSLAVCFMRFALQPASIMCCGRGWGFTGYYFSSIGKFNLKMLPSAWATF